MKSTPAQPTNSTLVHAVSPNTRSRRALRRRGDGRSAAAGQANGHGTERPPTDSRRSGSVLLVVVFVVAFTSLVLIGILKSVELQVAEQRATLRYERANYLAGAGVHHALMELQEDITWRGEIPETPFTPGSDEFYSATVVDAPEGGVVITAYGTSGEVTRRLEVLAE